MQRIYDEKCGICAKIYFFSFLVEVLQFIRVKSNAIKFQASLRHHKYARTRNDRPSKYLNNFISNSSYPYLHPQRSKDLVNKFAHNFLCTKRYNKKTPATHIHQFQSNQN